MEKGQSDVWKNLSVPVLAFSTHEYGHNFKVVDLVLEMDPLDADVVRDRFQHDDAFGCVLSGCEDVLDVVCSLGTPTLFPLVLWTVAERGWKHL